ncbi:hypothetical protein [Spiroplasma alleghenense]|uniref:Uncharacterized protein n=1 Tax=Spiroplasma alleghenense TaxID=216931 RepID=A0A345Z3N6_9MOLU|nr:hypothetical protein [Spiroplasma alleghenense]AXK51215.1 hypothetical protein SALLE_v1c05410 [Spiroplasma alleghenense]
MKYLLAALISTNLITPVVTESVSSFQKLSSENQVDVEFEDNKTNKKLCNGDVTFIAPANSYYAEITAASALSQGWKKGTSVRNVFLGNIKDFNESYECIAQYRGLGIKGDMWANYKNGKKPQNLDGFGVNKQYIARDYIMFFETREFMRKEGWATQKVEISPEVYIYKDTGDVYLSCYSRAYSTGAFTSVILDAKIKQIDFIW